MASRGWGQRPGTQRQTPAQLCGRGGQHLPPRGQASGIHLSACPQQPCVSVRRDVVLCIKIRKKKKIRALFGESNLRRRISSLIRNKLRTGRSSATDLPWLCVNRWIVWFPHVENKEPNEFWGPSSFRDSAYISHWKYLPQGANTLFSFPINCFPINGPPKAIWIIVSLFLALSLHLFFSLSLPISSF